MRFPIAILLQVFLTWPTLAQQRFELAIDRNKNNTNYTIVPMYEKGLALINDSPSGLGRENIWNITLLDTALQATFYTTLPLDERYTLLGHDYNSGKVYFLFYNSNQNSAPYHLVRLSPATKIITRYSITHELDYTLSFFYVVDDHALFGGKVSKEPLVMSFNLEGNNTKIIPGFFQGDTELLDVHPNANNSFSILMQKRSQGESKLDLKILNTDGNILFQAQTKIEKQRTILSGFSSSLGTDELIVAGTWTQGKSKMACGFYSWHINMEDQNPQFVNFLELNNFTDYQNKKQQERLRKKAAKLDAKGNMPNHYVYVRPTHLEENSTGFFLHAEVKEIVTAPSNRSTWSGSSYPGSYGYGYRDFSGPFNQYYHPNHWYSSSNAQSALVLESVALHFDNTGRLKSDFSLPMKSTKGDYEEQMSDFVTMSGQLTFATKEGNNVYRKRIDLSGQQTVSDTLTLLPPTPNKVEALAENSGIRYWYADNFYVWGYQSYQPSQTNKNIEVFFVSKLKSR